MKKSIGVYLLNDKIFIHSKIGTQSVPAFSEPLFEIDFNSDNKLIGEKIRECIESYQQGARERYGREKWKTVNDPLIKLAREKNSKSFFAKVKNPNVVLINDILYFNSTENHGWKDGFKGTSFPNIELVYSQATDEDLGAALKKAFELSSIVGQDKPDV